MTGKQITGVIVDEAWQFDDLWVSDQRKDAAWTSVFEAMKHLGITPPTKALKDFKASRAFMRYALKRARSSHPHNAKWRVVGDLFTAAQVAAKFREHS